MARKPLDRWIDERMRDSDKEGKLSQLTLVVMIGMQQQELHTVRFTESSELQPKVLADMFQGMAKSYSQDLPGSQTFQLLAFYGGRSEPEARQPFAVMIDADIHNSGLTTEAPTQMGRTQQDMRHNEMMLGAIMRRQAQMDERADARDDRNINFIDRLMGRQEKLMLENMQAFEVVKDCIMKLSDETHKHRMEQENYRRSTQERAKLLAMAPALANQLMGKEIFPQANEDTAIIEAAAEAIAPEHLQMLQHILPANVYAALIGRIEKYNKKKEEFEAKVSALPAGSVDAEVGTDEPAQH